MSAELQELLHSMYIVLQLEACILYSLYYDLKLTAMLVQVAKLWQSSCRLTEVGQAAAVKARSWTEAANAATLLSIVQRAMYTNIS